MLTPELIPNKEPMIRVGLILPEDSIKTIHISFSDFQCFEIVSEDRHLPSFKSTASLNVNIVDGKLVIPEIDFCDASLKIIPSTSTEYPFITVDGIPAGRGFHWEKKISASYWGILELTIFDGQMMAVNELPLEQYLKCVATSEMSAKCPSEFLKAQTIVARSWLLANIEQKHRNLGVDICNDDCCQRYQGMAHCTDASIKSADVTFGQVIMFDEKICDARYSKSCGGITENFENVWEGGSIPYLVSVVDNDAKGTAFCSPEIVLEGSLKNYIGNVDEKGQYFRWEFEATQGELIQSLKNKRNVAATEIVQLIPEKIGYSGRIIVLRIEYKDFQNNLQSIEIHSEYEIRNIMSPSFLYSSAFSVEKNENGNFNLIGKGWGHGVGLCQIGALGRALNGQSTDNILNHYYSVSKLKRIYSS